MESKVEEYNIGVKEKEIRFEQRSKLNPWKCLKSIFSAITVEPIAILLITPRLLCTLALDNLCLEKACLVNLALNETICEAMVVRNRSGYAPGDEIAVQKVVSRLLPYKAFSHIFQIFFILLVGNWSDRTGKRRSMFVVPYVGDITAALGFLVCVYFFMELGVEYPVFIESLFSIALGGVPLLMAGVYSYIATISDTKSRTVRVGAASMVLRTSMTLGIAVSGFMYKYLGFYGVFCCSLVMNSIGFIFIFVIVKDVQPDEKFPEKKEVTPCCLTICNSIYESISGSIRVCFKSGPNRRRTTMILLQTINILTFGIMTAESSVLYLYSRKQFGWNEVDFSIFKSYRTVVELSGCGFVLVFLSKQLQWTDTRIALLACLSRFAGAIVLAFAKTDLLFYIGTFVDMFSAAIIIAVRSMITKTVQPGEQAMANSLTAFFDALGAFLVGSLYAFVYYQTLAIFPGTFFLVSILIYIPIFLMLLFLRSIVNGNKIVEVKSEK